MRAAAYARFSTDNQQDTSIEKQLEDIRAYCHKKGYMIVKEYVDKAESAAKEDRPAFRQLLMDAKDKLFDVVVVHKLNRLARNRYLSVITKHELQKYGVKIESVLEPIGDDPVGQLLWGILDAVNEFERLQVAQETKLKMKPLAEKGYWMGGRVPYGFKAEKVKDESGKTHTILVPNPEEVPVVREIFELFCSGFSYTRIAEHLNKKCQNRGKPWRANAIAEIIRNPRYAGKHFWNKGTKTQHRIWKSDAIVVEVDPIVPVKLFEKAQARINNYVRQRRQRYNYWLSGIAFCECGAQMWGARTYSPSYVCKEYKKASALHAVIPAKRLEEFVKAYLREKLDKSSVDFEALAAAYNELNQDARNRHDQLVQRWHELKDKIDKLTEALAVAPVSAHKYITQHIDEAVRELESIENTLSMIQREAKMVTPEELMEMYDSLLELLETDPEQVAKRMIKRVVVYKSGYISIEPSFTVT